MKSTAKTVTEYIAALPIERQKEISLVREMILTHLPKGYEEVMQYGMIGYVVPLRIYPKGYDVKKLEPLPFLGLASQKNYISLHLMCLYSDAHTEAQFRKNYAKSGKKLEMGKSCIRFKKASDLALDVLGNLIANISVEKWIHTYETARQKR